MEDEILFWVFQRSLYMTKKHSLYWALAWVVKYWVVMEKINAHLHEACPWAQGFETNFKKLTNKSPTRIQFLHKACAPFAIETKID